MTPNLKLRRGRLRLWVWSVLLLSLQSFVGLGQAQSIGVNFVGGAGTAGTLLPSDIAGVPGYAQGSWNNAFGNFASQSNLLDSAGHSTLITAEWLDVSGVSDTGTAGAGPNFTLMRGYLTASLPGNGIVFRSIPYPEYDILVYLSGPLSTSGSSGRLYFRSPDFNAFPPAAEMGSPAILYSQTFAGNLIEASPGTPGNYYRFSGLTYDSVGVGSIEFGLSAVQIIPVPEPSAPWFLAIGLAYLVLRHTSRGEMRRI